jgi:hypothetical protein
MSIFKSALYSLIHLFGYSAFLFPSCFDLDIERIEDDLRKTEMSKQKYINQLRNSEDWYVGTVQSNNIKNEAEDFAISSLARMMQSHIRVEMEREVNELFSKDEIIFTDKRKLLASVTVDKILSEPEVIAIRDKENDIYKSIALKCKASFNKEKKLKDEHYYTKASESLSEVAEILYDSRDVRILFEKLVRAYFYISQMNFDLEKKNSTLKDIEIQIQKNLKNIKVTLEDNILNKDGEIVVKPFKQSNQYKITLSYVTDQPSFIFKNNNITLDAMDFIARFENGIVSNSNRWVNNEKTFTVNEGLIDFDYGRINTSTADLEVGLYLDLRDYLNTLKYLDKDFSIKRMSDANKELETLFFDNPIYVIRLNNDKKISISFENKTNKNFNINTLQLKDYPDVEIIPANTLTKTAHWNIQHHYGKLLFSLDGQHVKSVPFTSPTNISITSAINKFFNEYDIVQLKYHFSNSYLCDTDTKVFISIENENFPTPKRIFKKWNYNNSIDVKKGRIRYKLIDENTEKVYKDTTFYIYDSKDLGDFHQDTDTKICVEKKMVTIVPNLVNRKMDLSKSILRIDGKVYRDDSEFNRNKEHRITYLENGYKEFYGVLEPTEDKYFYLTISPERVPMKYFKYSALPGSYQIEFHNASQMRQIEGWFYKLTLLGLVYKSYGYYKEYNTTLNEYTDLVNTYQNLENFYQVSFDEMNGYSENIILKHGELKQNSNNFEKTLIYIAGLYICNWIEIGIEEFIF